MLLHTLQSGNTAAQRFRRRLTLAERRSDRFDTVRQRDKLSVALLRFRVGLFQRVFVKLNAFSAFLTVTLYIRELFFVFFKLRRNIGLSVAAVAYTVFQHIAAHPQLAKLALPLAHYRKRLLKLCAQSRLVAFRPVSFFFAKGDISILFVYARSYLRRTRSQSLCSFSLLCGILAAFVRRSLLRLGHCLGVYRLVFKP